MENRRADFRRTMRRLFALPRRGKAGRGSQGRQTGRHRLQLLRLCLAATAAAWLLSFRAEELTAAGERFWRAGVTAAGRALMEDWIPGADGAAAGAKTVTGAGVRQILLAWLQTAGEETDAKNADRPDHGEILAKGESTERAEDTESAKRAESAESAEHAERAESAESAENAESTGSAERAAGGEGREPGGTAAAGPAQETVIREKLADYDYMMKQFYVVHPTTTANRELMNAEKFLSTDLTLAQNTDAPQILIYHTHSQEEYADYPENPDATIVSVGTYLAGLLEEKGWRVIHDTGIYDFQNGELDRSQAYTYALDGITGILQEYPSIAVVLDIHRDGVAAGTRLVTEINGKPTAKIMFFNGLSQTPEGPIEYLANPNRDANLAFSFQLELAAAEAYPGFTRKIYLKGLRYNQHVRPRACLVEVGAQTNTLEEAKNAMEPLAELLCGVLSGNYAASKKAEDGS